MSDGEQTAPPTEPEAVQGIILATDNALIPRPANIDLPAIKGDESTWGLIGHAALLSRMVAGTEFVPTKLRNRPAAVAGLMLLGHELGLGPMTAMQAMTVTPDGDVITYSKTLRALARAHGHKIWVDADEYTSQRVRWWGHRGDDSEHVMSVVWTMDDARQAKLVRPGSAWDKTPRAMLSARASAELCRLLDEDGLLGISYTAEEAADETRVVGIEPPPATPGEPGEPPVDTAAPDAPKTRRRQIARASVTPTEAAAALAVPGDAQEATPAEPPSASPPQVPAAEQAPPPDTTPVQGNGQVSDSSGAPTQAGAAEPQDAAPALSVPGDEITAEARAAAIQARGEIAREQLGFGPAPLAVPGDGPTPFAQAIDEARPRMASPMPPAQMIGMLARGIEVDRAVIATIASTGRTTHAKELTNAEASDAIGWLRAIGRGEMRLEATEEGTPPILVETSAAELAARAKQLLLTLDGEKVPTVLASHGWTKAAGTVTVWLDGLPRSKIGDLVADVRQAIAGDSA